MSLILRDVRYFGDPLGKSFASTWHFLRKCQKVTKLCPKGIRILAREGVGFGPFLSLFDIFPKSAKSWQKGPKNTPPEFVQNRQKSSKNTKKRVFFAKNRGRFWRASTTNPQWNRAPRRFHFAQNQTRIDVKEGKKRPFQQGRPRKSGFFWLKSRILFFFEEELFPAAVLISLW